MRGAAQKRRHSAVVSRVSARLAVIGPNADHAYNQLGDYTPAQRPREGTHHLPGAAGRLPACQIELARGCAVREKGRDGFPEAVEAARRAEAVVLVLGGSSARESDEAGTETGAAVAANLREMNGGEGADYASLTLDGEPEGAGPRRAGNGDAGRRRTGARAGPTWWKSWRRGAPPFFALGIRAPRGRRGGGDSDRHVQSLWASVDFHPPQRGAAAGVLQL